MGVEKIMRYGVLAASLSAPIGAHAEQIACTQEVLTRMTVAINAKLFEQIERLNRSSEGKITYSGQSEVVCKNGIVTGTKTSLHSQVGPRTTSSTLYLGPSNFDEQLANYMAELDRKERIELQNEKARPPHIPLQNGNNKLYPANAFLPPVFENSVSIQRTPFF